MASAPEPDRRFANVDYHKVSRPNLNWMHLASRLELPEPEARGLLRALRNRVVKDGDDLAKNGHVMGVLFEEPGAVVMLGFEDGKSPSRRPTYLVRLQRTSGKWVIVGHEKKVPQIDYSKAPGAVVEGSEGSEVLRG